MAEVDEVPTVRDTATVTVGAPVDGTKKRKTRSDKGKKRGPRRTLTTLTLNDVVPEVRAAAQATRKKGQKFRIVSPTEGWVMNN